ncbi:MAG: selenide, water dikinase SelD [Candidatus Thermoplasmatota archaeon]|nr:selenide, water dikinase SelD [Candidatus Thermoplasmatota archaeon]
MSVGSTHTFSGGCAGKCSRDLVEAVLEICRSYGHQIEWSDCNIIPEVEGELIQSVDIINQIVPDPETFGRIAAAHSCSDIYVAGGAPIICNMILGIPRGTPLSIVMESVKGAAEFMFEQGVQIRGGHTIHSHTLQLGFSVIGNRPQLLTMPPITEGDYLILTKPIGTGLMSNSLHSGDDTSAWESALFSTLIEPNSGGLLLCNQQNVKGVTDVTGFGLAFGIQQLCESQGAHATIWLESIPVFTGWERYAIEGYYPSLAYRNKEMLCFENEDNIPLWQELLLYDPQTNGSILAIVSSESIPVLTTMLEANDSQLHVIGRICGDSYRLKEGNIDE